MTTSREAEQFARWIVLQPLYTRKPREKFTVIGVLGCIMTQPLNYGTRETKPQDRRMEDAESRSAKEEEILPEVKEDFHTINNKHCEPP